MKIIRSVWFLSRSLYHRASISFWTQRNAPSCASKVNKMLSGVFNHLILHSMPIFFGRIKTESIHNYEWSSSRVIDDNLSILWSLVAEHIYVYIRSFAKCRPVKSFTKRLRHTVFSWCGCFTVYQIDRNTKSHEDGENHDNKRKMRMNREEERKKLKIYI